MFKIVVLILAIGINLFALSLSSDDDYNVFKSDKYNITFTSDYKNEAQFIKENLDEFLKLNDKSFGFSFVQPIEIVLISNNIQVPNAFSTQVPYNLGVYFNGGSGMNDYFASSSWLTTLLTHEMVHNYQTNAKKSEISKTLHKYLGNNYMPVWAVAPFFTLPNLLLPTALLEGNSVLNETLYNNGGRLYSGRLNALKNTLVFDNKIAPTSFINDHLKFPYTQEKYIVGGFYMQYLAYKYGVDKVNQLFYENSIHSINPFLLNSTFVNHFNIEFEQSVEDFVNFTKNKYKDFNKLKDKNIIGHSKDELYLNKIDNKIYFITTDLTKDKLLNIYDLNTYNNTYLNTTLSNGKVFNIDDKLYVSSNDYISSTLYKYGLFDEDNYIENSTIGKAVNDIYNEKIAYVNIKESFLNTKLYIDDEFYDEVSSEAIFDNAGNIYYFKQNDNKRILVKNKKEIYRFKGYYSKVVDIVDNEIYFIANTKNGSTLYKYGSDTLYRLNNSDNIINGKIIDTTKALVVSVTSNGYDIQVIDLEQNEVNNVSKTENIKLDSNFSFKNKKENKDLETKTYNAFEQLKFSMLYPSYSYDSQDGSSYFLNALFIDPIMFNMVNLYAFKNTDDKITGVSYTNERYIPYTIDIYDRKREVEYQKERGYGASLEVYGPLIQKARNLLEASLKQLFDDKNKDKNPTTLSLNYIYKETFSLEDSPYFLSDTKMLLKQDRGDLIYGINYKLNKHLIDELYFNMELAGVFSNTDTLTSQRGIEVVIDEFDNKDSTNIFMEGFDYDFFVKDITKLSAGLSKTFHLSSYFSKFPISLRKESLFYTYNQFDLTTIANHTIKERIIGTKLDLLFFHKLPLPLTIKYIQNDKSVDDYKVTVSLGMEF